MSGGSLIVAAASFVIAVLAKRQARKGATLEHRVKAIIHVRQAHFDVTNNGYVAVDTIKSIQEARNLAALVFGHKVRNELDQAHETASRLIIAPNRLEHQHSPENTELGKNLQRLIARMNKEAAT